MTAFSTLGCPEATLPQVFELARRHGITAVELRALGGDADLLAYLERTYGSPAALARQLPAEGPAIVALDTTLRVMEWTTAEREAFMRLVPWAEALRVPRLRVFDGGQRCGDEELERAAAFFRWWDDRRRHHGWQTDLMVETHDSLLTTPAIQRFLAAVPHVALLWDSHHTWRKGGEAPAVTFRAIRHAVCHVHVKDSTNAGSMDACEYVLPGTGAFPFDSLVGALRDGAFAGPVVLEWERLWFTHLPPLEAALKSAAAHGWWDDRASRPAYRPRSA